MTTLNLNGIAQACTNTHPGALEPGPSGPCKANIDKIIAEGHRLAAVAQAKDTELTNANKEKGEFKKKVDELNKKVGDLTKERDSLKKSVEDATKAKTDLEKAKNEAIAYKDKAIKDA